MKKILFIPFVMFALILTSCKEMSVETPTISDDYTAAVEINYEDNTYTADIHRIGQGVWTAELTSPDTVSGMSMHYENGEVSVRYKGFSVSLPSGKLPMKGALAKTFAALDSIYNDSSVEAKSAEAGTIVIEGESEDAKYIITFNRDGELMSVNIPAYQLSVKTVTSQPTEG